jgi:hypothetical protein
MMRAYSSILILLSVVLGATACDNAPVGIPDQDDAALQPETMPCPTNPALPSFLQTSSSCPAQ